MKDNFLKAIMAGAAIALGCCLYLLAPTNIIGAILFSCGLLCVRIYGLHLFTGKTQYIVTKELSLKNYAIIFIGNIIGVLVMGVITYNLINEPARLIAEAKNAQPFINALIKGIGCGMLMSLATYSESPLWMCLLCVPGFILTGFNHCIADAYYAFTGMHISINFLATVLGNIIGGAVLLNGQIIKNRS